MFDIWTEPPTTWIWIIANGVIALSYLAIGAAQVRAHHAGRMIFGVFILACGCGHAMMAAFMGFWPTAALWEWVVLVDVITAAVSLPVAIAWRMF